MSIDAGNSEAADRPPAGLEPAIRTLAMPADTNPDGDIFGGWIMAHMDIAGASVAVGRAGGRVATVAVAGMAFHKPIYVGDMVSCYAVIERIGRTSITVKVEAFARRARAGQTVKVTEATFTYVALGNDRRPRPVATP